jgi:hypothetical protein
MCASLCTTLMPLCWLVDFEYIADFSVLSSIPIARSINPDDSVDLSRLSFLNSALDGSWTVCNPIGRLILTDYIVPVPAGPQAESYRSVAEAVGSPDNIGTASHRGQSR